MRGHTAAVETLHAIATMPKAHPERVVQGFRQAERAVTSNARCLTDVVDVPAMMSSPSSRLGRERWTSLESYRYHSILTTDEPVILAQTEPYLLTALEFVEHERV